MELGLKKLIELILNILQNNCIITISNYNMRKQQRKTQRRSLINRQRRYAKMFYRQKMYLLKRMLIDKAQIKETSVLLGVKYSTAKTFLRKYKASKAVPNLAFLQDVCKWFDQNSMAQQRCSYKLLDGESIGTCQKKSQLQLSKAENESSVSNCSISRKHVNQVLKPKQIQIIQQVLFQSYIPEQA